MRSLATIGYEMIIKALADRKSDNNNPKNNNNNNIKGEQRLWRLGTRFWVQKNRKLKHSRLLGRPYGLFYQ